MAVIAATANPNWPFVGRAGMIAQLTGLHAGARCAGVLLQGPAGIGKTRLADEFTSRLDDAVVVRCVATPASQTVPYAAIAHLIPGDPSALSANEPRRVLGLVRSVFGGKRAVLTADDIAYLDESSLTLCAHLLALDELFLVGTLRSDVPVPSGLDSLIRSFDLQRIDVEALDSDSIGEAATRVIGAPLEPSSMARLAQRCGGNPLYVREFLLQSVASKAVTLTPSGQARIDIDVSSVPRLIELVGSRLESISPSLRPLLHMIAIAEPLTAGDLATLELIEEATELEQAGWIRADRRGASIEIRLAHPLYSEVLRSTMGVFEYRRQVVRIADAVRRRPTPLRDDALRVAIWELDAGLQPEPSVLLEGARRARAVVDLASTIRLADAAYRVEPSGASQVLLLEALFLGGRFDEAESCGSMPVNADSLDVTTLVTLMMLRMDNLLWGIADADRAWALIQSYRPAFAERRIEFLLAVPEAFVKANTGRSAEAVELLGPEPSDSTLFLLSSLSRCITLSARGRFEQALATAQRGLDLVATLPDPRSSVDPLFFTTNQAIAWTGLGRFTEVRDALVPAHAGIVEDRMVFLRCLAGMVTGHAALAQGDLTAADRWFTDTTAATAQMNLPSARRVGAAGRAAVAGQRGDLDQARSCLDELDALGPDLDYMVVETQVGRSWAQYCLGSHGEARRDLRAATSWAIESDEPVAALIGLTELARLDDAAWAVGHLDDIASIHEIDGPLAPARIAFVRASAGRSGAPLLAAARALEACGAHLVAAEAANLARQRLERDGNTRDAAAAQAIVAAALVHCGDARTPALAVTQSTVALSKREIEVATLAATGISSRAIAEQLFVSARTVENHLQRVYIKLGISGRDDLASHLESSRSEPISTSR